MPLMSRPRAATSVATSSLMRASLRSLSACSRSRWPLSPWMAEQGTPFWLRSRESWSHMRFVLQNTMPLAAAFARSATPAWRRTSISIVFLLCGLQALMICVMSWLPFSSSRFPICTWKASRRNSLARRRTLAGHVAVKNSVWRCLGILARILRICGSKPMSSMRSASSSTSFSTRSRRNWLPSRKSLMRPGVPMTPWTPARSSRSCSCLGAPP
mmetsp:Transcript_126173/g.342544  ORF Transcript_126173/g.342544 Transcript_126173/m.342544 type:complete len:214 (+) Transcript_126173:501-1142(+)